MAKAASDEQVQLRRRARRRLVGAIALVTLIAVVLPWVLEREPRPSEEPIAIKIPSQDTPFEHRVPAPTEAPREPAAEPAEPGGGGSEGLRTEQEKVLAAPEKAPPKDRAAPAEAKRKAADEADKKAQFVVQIAALADADKAAVIQRELAAKGLKSYTEKVKTGSGDVTRVRVGPFPSREQAEKERARLKSLGFEGNVSPR